MFEVKYPVPGELWTLKRDNDPWGGRDNLNIKILDVRDGWVRYYIGPTFNDERLEMDRFLYCYIPSNVNISGPQAPLHGPVGHSDGGNDHV